MSVLMVLAARGTSSLFFANAKNHATPTVNVASRWADELTFLVRQRRLKYENRGAIRRRRRRLLTATSPSMATMLPPTPQPPTGRPFFEHVEDEIGVGGGVCCVGSSGGAQTAH